MPALTFQNGARKKLQPTYFLLYILDSPSRVAVTSFDCISFGREIELWTRRGEERRQEFSRVTINSMELMRLILRTERSGQRQSSQQCAVIKRCYNALLYRGPRPRLSPPASYGLYSSTPFLNSHFVIQRKRHIVVYVVQTTTCCHFDGRGGVSRRCRHGNDDLEPNRNKRLLCGRIV